MSEQAASWSIFGGRGNVGSALIEMVAKPRVAAHNGLKPQPDLVGGRAGWGQGSADGEIVTTDLLGPIWSDVLFITAPSTEDNEPILPMVREHLRSGRTVITAEKKSTAEHLTELQRLRGKLGLWATVGGGTKMVQKMTFDTQDRENIRDLVLCPNATLTYALGEVSNGGNMVEVLQAARKLGFAEPKATNAYDVVTGEFVHDITAKTVLTLAAIFPDIEPVKLDELKDQTVLEPEHVNEVFNHADLYRSLVGVFHERAAQRVRQMAEGRQGGFEIEHEGLLIIGGFMRVDATSAFGQFSNTSGPTAGYYVALGPEDGSSFDGENIELGTGAGAATTANAMLDNYRFLTQA